MRRYAKSAIVVGVLVIAIAIAIMMKLGKDSERRGQEARDFYEAPGRFAEYAKNYESSLAGGPFVGTTCYGARWDGYSRKIYEDVNSHRGDKEYNLKMAEHYRRLTLKYQEALRRKERPMSLDPPLSP